MRKKYVAVTSLMVLGSIILSTDCSADRYRNRNDPQAYEMSDTPTDTLDAWREEDCEGDCENIESRVAHTTDNTPTPTFTLTESDYLDFLCKDLDYLLTHPVACVKNYFEGLKKEIKESGSQDNSFVDQTGWVKAETITTSYNGQDISHISDFGDCTIKIHDESGNLVEIHLSR